MARRPGRRRRSARRLRRRLEQLPSGGASHASTLTAVRTTTVYAFDINPSTDELIPAPGTPPGVISEGDESIINDQLTSTHLAGHGASAGYPIVGYDSGTCTFTRVSPDGQPSNSAFDTTLERLRRHRIPPQRQYHRPRRHHHPIRDTSASHASRHRRHREL